MKRIKCTVAYDGSPFAGYQIQPGKRTVQLEIEKALSGIHKGEKLKITASGRTDAGVHAKGQVFHFDTKLSIPENKWPTVLNSMLPPEIVITSAETVPKDFHARFSAVKKEYRYSVYRSKTADPFKRHFSLHYPFPLNIEEMRKAAEHLIGQHDFTSFCSAKTEVEDKVRTIHTIEIEEREEEITFSYTGNGFLYNMVRILSGTLLEVGRGKYSAEETAAMLEARDRSAAGKTAAPQGLYLWKVYY
ncbi:tRNA pseudouridine(38-40) synthase TruA [Rossellomorea vietnamensis]|uniref:tRNA pseudouridine synthase A n=1 Tax=Rossellomorea vietnamensis TaxID=218284 RepID=A0A5D4M696_9BACI|nr:tRNA pseudouridine(38-40) synthase TruA [Rossellomorea vietnamensis]TYR97444.1 tRNA pseudouridine(38-40) synthase TruA [Rossellomorea vietnamensis]